MNRILFALFLSASLAVPAVAQQKGGTPPTKSSSKTAWPAPKAADKTTGAANVTVTQTDYSREPYIVQQYITRTRFEKDGTGRREEIARILVQSESGVEQLGQLVWGYNSANEKLDVSYVRVRKADGSLVTATADAVQDLTAPISREAPMYTDFHQKHITVPGLRPGETLEYAYTVTTHTPLAPGQFWAEHEFWETGIVLDQELEINVPAATPVKLKCTTGHEPKTTDEGDRRIYRWTWAHLTNDDDSSAPGSKGKKKKKKSPDDAKPDVQLTTFPNWDEVGRWYAGLERDRRSVTPEIQAKANALIAGRATDMDKVEALYDFVAKNFRYVSLSFGVGRYQPHQAADVFANQYGDCKDKNTLLAAMLKAAGFQSNSVLINSSRKLDPDVPSPAQFDHVITQVPVGKETIWLDTTTEVAPFRLLMEPLRKKQALVVAQGGAPSGLQETPAEAATGNYSRTEVDGSVSELGKLTLHQKEIMRGDVELALRMVFRRLPETRWKDVLQYAAAINGINGEITDYKVSDPAATREPFVMEMTVSQPNFVDWTKKRSSVALPLSKLNLPELDEDEDPLKIGIKIASTVQMKLEFPAKYTLRLPVPVSVKRDYAEYSSDYKLEGHTLTATRHYVSNADELPASRLSDLNAFRRAIKTDDDQKLGIEGDGNATGDIPATAKVEELEDAADNARQSGNFSLALKIYKRVVELEPKHKYAWNNMGITQLGMMKYEDAAASFRKAIEVNEFDEWAYNNLGRALRNLNKYDEAEKAFQKQIEINPLDQYAHSNLGELYTKMKRYQDAVTELEKAAAIKPNDANVQVYLGDAYLNLDQNDKALAAFDRAIEIAPVPLMWNNIAYQLALKKAHLDRAQQYAESAVASVTAAMRNLPQSNNAELAELAMESQLVSYWDTLGWVHFQRGNIEKAEKYLNGAWTLALESAAGDHLAQLYLARGEREKAINMFALAVAADRADPETRDRLSKLVPDSKQVDSLIEKARTELTKFRTVSLGNVGKKGVAADFALVVSAGGKIEEAKFVRGSDELKSLADTILKAPFNIILPEDAPIRVVVRGSVSCGNTGDCSFRRVSFGLGPDSLPPGYTAEIVTRQVSIQ